MNTSDLEEKMVEVDAETAKREAFDLKKFYRKHPELNFASLSGGSKRKLVRANTVHLRGICPACGSGGMKWYKRIALKNGSSYSGVWYCKNCNHVSNRKELEYVKYA